MIKKIFNIIIYILIGAAAANAQTKEEMQKEQKIHSLKASTETDSVFRGELETLYKTGDVDEIIKLLNECHILPKSEWEHTTLEMLEYGKEVYIRKDKK